MGAELCSCIGDLKLPTLTDEQQESIKTQATKVLEESKDLQKLYVFLFKEKQAIFKDGDLDKLHDETLTDEFLKVGSGVNQPMKELVKEFNEKVGKVVTELLKDSIISMIEKEQPDIPQWLKDKTVDSAVGAAVPYATSALLKQQLGESILHPEKAEKAKANENASKEKLHEQAKTGEVAQQHEGVANEKIKSEEKELQQEAKELEHQKKVQELKQAAREEIQEKKEEELREKEQKIEQREEGVAEREEQLESAPNAIAEESA